MSHWLNPNSGMRFPARVAAPPYDYFQGTDFVPEAMAGGGEAEPPPKPSTIPPVFSTVSLGGSGTSVVKPACAVGDLAIVALYLSNGTSYLRTNSGESWAGSVIGPNVHGYYHGVFWKILTTTDVNQGWSILGGTVDYESICAIYTNGGLAFTEVVVKASVENPAGQSSLVIPGFEPSPSHRGVVAICIDRDGQTMTPPSGFTERIDSLSTYYRYGLADKLSDYDGSDMTFGVYAVYAEVGFALEIR